MPVLLFIVRRALTLDFDVVVEDRGATALTGGSKERGVVLGAVDLSLPLVVRVILSKDEGTEGAGEVVEVKLELFGPNEGPFERRIAFRAEETQPPEMVKFTEELPVRSLKEIVDNRLGAVLRHMSGDEPQIGI